MKTRKITPRQFDQFVKLYVRVKAKGIELAKEEFKEIKLLADPELKSIDIEPDGSITVIYFEPEKWGGGVYGKDHYFYFDKEWVCDLL
jgi:hypothetical protein